mgnify:CR=1 FL=1
MQSAIAAHQSSSILDTKSVISNTTLTENKVSQREFMRR